MANKFKKILRDEVEGGGINDLKDVVDEMEGSAKNALGIFLDDSDNMIPEDIDENEDDGDEDDDGEEEGAQNEEPVSTAQSDTNPEEDSQENNNSSNQNNNNNDNNSSDPNNEEDQSPDVDDDSLNKNKKRDENVTKGGPAQAGETPGEALSKEKNADRASDMATNKEGQKASLGSNKEGKDAAKAGVNAAKGGADAVAGAGEAAAGAGEAAAGAGGAAASAGGGAAAGSAAAGAGAAAGGAAAGGGAAAIAGGAAAGPVGWVAAAAALLKKVGDSPELGMVLFFPVAIIFSLIFIIFMLAVMVIIAVAAVIGAICKAAFTFVLKLLGDEPLTEDATLEDRYAYIADIIRDKVKEDYDKMISDWKRELTAHKGNVSENEWGIALEHSGYPTPNLSTTDEASLNFKVGTGHDDTVHAMHSNWAYSKEVYLAMFPRGIRDKNGKYMIGTEPYFDYQYSLSQMDDGSNNGAVKNMGYLIAGYNASRAEMPITDSNNWFVRHYQSYRWDITSDTWWTDILSTTGFKNYFEYESTLNHETRTRTVSEYTPVYWVDIIAKKTYEWPITITVTPLNSSYGADDGFIGSTSSTISLTTHDESYDGQINALKEYYQNVLDYGVEWDPSFELSDSSILKPTYIDVNNYSIPTNTLNSSFVNFNLGNGKSVSPTFSLDGSYVHSESYTKWIEVGTVTNYSGEVPAQTGTSVGSHRYFYKELSATDIVMETGSGNGDFNESDKTSGSDPYYYTYRNYDTYSTNTSGDYDPSYEDCDPGPTNPLTGEPMWYNITSHVHEWTKKRYEYVYTDEELQEKGIKVQFSTGSPYVISSENYTFNKSTYEDVNYNYEYYWLKSKSNPFNNSLFIEVMLEKSNQYYKTVPTTVSTAPYLAADGSSVPAMYDLPVEDALDMGLISVIPTSDQYRENGSSTRLIGGIGDWPYYGNIEGYEYTCGAVGTKPVCTARPSADMSAEEAEEYDPYNHKDGGEACGCGAPIKQQQTSDAIGEDSIAATTVSIFSNLCSMKTEFVLMTDADGNPILDENGNKQYEQQTTVLTVQERIEEINEEFRQILENYEEEENVSSLGLVTGNYGDVTDLVKYAISIIMSSESGQNYTAINRCDAGNSFSIGLIQWYATSAQELLKNIYAAAPEKVENIWAETDEYKNNDHKNDPFYINDSSKWQATSHNTCEHSVSESFITQLKEVLGLTESKDTQDAMMAARVEGYINQIRDKYGITDPATLVWLADIDNQYGWGGLQSNFGTIIATGQAATTDDSKLLTNIYNAYLTQKSASDPYYNRRSAVYAQIMSDVGGALPSSMDQKTAASGGEGVIYTTGSIDVVYYNQASGWKNYGSSTAAAGACGPTSCAIVASTFLSTEYNPNYMIDWAVANGYRVEGQGSAHSIIDGFCADFGLSVTHATTQQQVVDALASGKLVVVLAGSTGSSSDYYTGAGHFFCLRGVTDEGKILVADCGSQTKTNNTSGYSLSSIWNNRKTCCGDTHVWIISPP